LSAGSSCSVPTLSFFMPPAAAQIHTLSLHDALPISGEEVADHRIVGLLGKEVVDGGEALGALAVPHHDPGIGFDDAERGAVGLRSEEHTSELQSRENLVCRLLLEKKKKNIILQPKDS